MMKFKVGDRVFIYGWVQMQGKPFMPRAGGKATIIYISEENLLQVMFSKDIGGKIGGDRAHYIADPKQCRHLVKKPRQRVFILKDELPMYGGRTYNSVNLASPECFTSDVPDGWTEFIEVRRK